MEPTTGSSNGKGARSPPPPFVAAVASNKGKKHTLEDVPIVCPSLDGSDGLLSLYAILDGHGGSECAEWCADRLPAILATRLATTDTSPAIKEAIKAAFNQCDAELIEHCNAKGWDDGTCAIALVIDRRCAPPRAYCANCGDSRAYAAVVPQAAASSDTAATSAGLRAISLSKDHTAVEPKERKRIESSGGFVQNGRVCGVLEVSRSFGDRRLKKGGELCRGSQSLSLPTPDVASFAIGPEQLFVLLGCDGLWRSFAGSQSIEWLHERLPAMDARRAEVAATLDDPASAAALTKEALGRIKSERERESEAGLLKAMCHEAVHARHATDNVTALLVRLS